MKSLFALTGLAAAFVAVSAWSQGLPPGISYQGGYQVALDPPANGDKKPTLEELLAKALQNSPEVQVAEARLKEAEAQLRQTRLQVAQKLVDLHAGMEQKQRNLSNAEVERKQAVELRKTGMIPSSELTQKENAIQDLKAQVAQLEASVNALTGRLPAFLNQVNGQAISPGGSPLAGGGLGQAAELPKRHMPRKPMADKMLAVLEQPMKKMDKGFENVMLADVLNFVRDQSPGVPFLFAMGTKAEEVVKIDFKGDITVGSFFQVLSDTVPDLRIYVRDYGFLVTFNGNEPDDSMPFMEFWRAQEPKSR